MVFILDLSDMTIIFEPSRDTDIVVEKDIEFSFGAIRQSEMKNGHGSIYVSITDESRLNMDLLVDELAKCVRNGYLFLRVVSKRAPFHDRVGYLIYPNEVVELKPYYIGMKEVDVRNLKADLSDLKNILSRYGFVVMEE